MPRKQLSATEKDNFSIKPAEKAPEDNPDIQRDY